MLLRSIIGGSKVGGCQGRTRVPNSFNYRPQRSYGKVMFSQASVILFTGGCLVDTSWGDSYLPVLELEFRNCF